MTRVSLRPRAIEGLRSAPNGYKVRINEAFDTLKRGDLPSHTKKLGGAPNGYRIRVGRWRILFVLDSGEVDVADIFLKKEKGDYRRRR